MGAVAGGASFDPLKGWPTDDKAIAALRERRQAWERRLNEHDLPVTPSYLARAMSAEERVHRLHA